MVFPFLLVGIVAYNVFSAARTAYSAYRTGRTIYNAVKYGLKRPPWKWIFKTLSKRRKRRKFKDIPEYTEDDYFYDFRDKPVLNWFCTIPEYFDAKNIDLDYLNFRIDQKANPKDSQWKEENNVDFVGVLILMGITYFSFLVSIIEVALFLMFYLMYFKDVEDRARMLKWWLVARFTCFIFCILLVALYIMAIVDTPKGFVDAWQNYVGLGIFLIVFAIGIATAVMAILRIHRHNEEVRASKKGSIVRWALGK